MRVLAGDIGATNTRLVLHEVEGPKSRVLRENNYASRGFSGLVPIVKAFLADDGEEVSVDAAAFGVAGPVRDGICYTTNLPWAIHTDELRTVCGTERVSLLNDWQIAVLALEDLDEDQQRTLQTGEPEPKGPIAAIGLGTGLGMALLVRTPSGPVPLPSEGGHVDFSPTDELQQRLWERLRTAHGRVSVERAVSGTALLNIYRTVIEQAAAPENPSVTARLDSEDPGAVIGELGARGEDAACQVSVQLLIKMLGVEAGNLALKVLPTGGLYVGGGAAVKLKNLFDGPIFLSAFLDKGRMRTTLERIPVKLVLEPNLGLLGALAAARHALAGHSA